MTAWSPQPIALPFPVLAGTITTISQDRAMPGIFGPRRRLLSRAGPRIPNPGKGLRHLSVPNRCRCYEIVAPYSSPSVPQNNRMPAKKDGAAAAPPPPSPPRKESMSSANRKRGTSGPSLKKSALRMLGGGNHSYRMQQPYGRGQPRQRLRQLAHACPPGLAWVGARASPTPAGVAALERSEPVPLLRDRRTVFQRIGAAKQPTARQKNRAAAAPTSTSMAPKPKGTLRSSDKRAAGAAPLAR
jgi:hypothetical protein